MLTTEGKYPLYDVSVRITDVEKQLAIGKHEMEKGNLPYDSMVRVYQLWWEASKLIPVGNIGPNQAIPLGTLKLPDSDKQTYIINIMARNGGIVQHLTCRRVNSVWKLAMKIFKLDNTIEETVEPDFPRDDKGNVQW